MISPIDVQKKVFNSSFRGYNKGEVDSFLAMISESLEQKFSEVQDLSDKSKKLNAELEKYKQLENTMSETLMVAKKTADDLVSSARKKEEILIKETEISINRRRQKSELEILDLQKNIDELRLKYESERIKLKNFFKAQLAMMDDNVPTIEEIQENSKKLLEKKLNSGSLDKEILNPTLESKKEDLNIDKVDIINNDTLKNPNLIVEHSKNTEKERDNVNIMDKNNASNYEHALKSETNENESNQYAYKECFDFDDDLNNYYDNELPSLDKIRSNIDETNNTSQNI